jgi:Rad3-related DNA helicase
LIVDEAQHLETAITGQLTVRVTYGRISRATERGQRTPSWHRSCEPDPGLLGALASPSLALAEEGKRLTKVGPRVLEAAKRFFEIVALAEAGSLTLRKRFRTSEELYGSEPDRLEELHQRAREAESVLESLCRAAGRLEPTPENEDRATDAEELLEWRALIADLERITDRAARTSHWREGGNPEKAEIAAAPSAPMPSVADSRRAVFARARQATLRVGDDFSYLRRALGLRRRPPIVERAYDSAFDYLRRCAPRRWPRASPRPRKPARSWPACIARCPGTRWRRSRATGHCVARGTCSHPRSRLAPRSGRRI